MGTFDFVSSAGRRVTVTGAGVGAAAHLLDTEPTNEVRAAAQAQHDAGTPAPLDPDAVSDNLLAEDIAGAVAALGLDFEHLEVAADDGAVTLTGAARTVDDAELAVLAAGNTQGVHRVHDRLRVLEEGPRSGLHTVKRGETLAGISQALFGSSEQERLIREANRPFLREDGAPDAGLVLRIPSRDVARVG